MRDDDASTVSILRSTCLCFASCIGVIGLITVLLTVFAWFKGLAVGMSLWLPFVGSVAMWIATGIVVDCEELR